MVCILKGKGVVVGVKTEYALNDAKIHKLVKLITVQITLSISLTKQSPVQPTAAHKKERERVWYRERSRQTGR